MIFDQNTAVRTKLCVIPFSLAAIALQMGFISVHFSEDGIKVYSYLLCILPLLWMWDFYYLGYGNLNQNHLVIFDDYDAIFPYWHKWISLSQKVSCFLAIIGWITSISKKRLASCKPVSLLVLQSETFFWQQSLKSI